MSTTIQWSVSTRSKLFSVVVVMLLAAFIPLPQTVAPDWIITTLDAHHKPLMGVTVREVWQQYSLEHMSHEEDRLTDSTGKVRFPRRQYWTSIGVRFLGCVRQVSSYGAHASCGPHPYLVAFGGGIDTLDWEDLSQEYGTTAPWQSSTLALKH
ncbi:MAG TPA: hypothetical protein VFA90_05025 [Terriglobales bacterium]|nr:hypothetical protein [Terriglobales bacterium]